MIWLLLAACSKSAVESDPIDTDEVADTDISVDTDDTDPAEVTLDGVCADEVRWGVFSVDSGPRYGYATGSVSDGVVPTNVLTRMLDSGDCTIWRRENPYCDGGCGSGLVCDLDGSCVPYPLAQPVGTVTISGLVQAVSMEPIPPGDTYFDTSLPNPPWVPGSLIELKTGGGTYEPVTLHGIAPVDLVPTTTDWTIEEGKPLSIAWDAPTAEVSTEVVLRLRIDQHGLTPSSITCAFPDTGEGAVPADVIDALMAYGITGFPAGDVVRRTADHASIGDGCVDFVATSTWVPGTITITGYTPCDREEDCPADQDCNLELQRCE